MMLDYFYGQSGELFAYFRIPKALFQDSRFRQLSTDARTLYGILLDRMSLSAKNSWVDEHGRVYMQNELGNAEPYFAATSPVLDLTVIRPDDAPHILPCFDEADEGISISEDEPLGFRYNPKQVIKLMGKRYLVGPVIFHRFDDDGNFASLTMSDMYAIQKYLESSSVTLMIDRDKLTCICID